MKERSGQEGGDDRSYKERKAARKSQGKGKGGRVPGPERNGDPCTSNRLSTAATDRVEREARRPGHDGTKGRKERFRGWGPYWSSPSSSGPVDSPSLGSS